MSLYFNAYRRQYSVMTTKNAMTEFHCEYVMDESISLAGICVKIQHIFFTTWVLFSYYMFIMLLFNVYPILIVNNCVDWKLKISHLIHPILNTRTYHPRKIMEQSQERSISIVVLPFSPRFRVNLHYDYDLQFSIDLLEISKNMSNRILTTWNQIRKYLVSGNTVRKSVKN